MSDGIKAIVERRLSMLTLSTRLTDGERAYLRGHMERACEEAVEQERVRWPTDWRERIQAR